MARLGFTWYPKDFISDPEVMMMTALERGVYRDLIDLAYMNDNAIKYNEEQLANYCKCDKSVVASVLEIKGVKHSAGYWVIPSCQKRLDLADKNRKNGQKGGRKKTQTEPKPNPSTKAKEKKEKEKEKVKEIESKREIKGSSPPHVEMVLGEPNFQKNFMSLAEAWLRETCKYRVNASDRSLHLKTIKHEIFEQHEMDMFPTDDFTLFETFKKIILGLDNFVKKKKFSMEYIASKIQEIYNGYRQSQSPQQSEANLRDAEKLSGFQKRQKKYEDKLAAISAGKVG